MILILKAARAAIVIAAYGALGYVIWKKLQPVVTPVPASVAADPVETARIADEIRPDEPIDLSAPLSTGDVDQAD